MKYGAMNFPIKPVQDELKRISDLGFDYFELTLDPPCAHYASILDMENELVSALKQYSMEVICHLPTFVYTADLCPGIRDISLKEMIHSLKTAARIGAEKAVLHPSFTSGLGPFVMETAKKYALQSLGAIVEQATRLQIELCFENMYPRYHTFFDPRQFQTVFKEFPSLKMCLDTGHGNIGDPDKTRLFEFIEKFPDKIGHVHISDNQGKRDDHFGVGRGNINFEKFMTQLINAGYNDTITFEIFSENTKDLLDSRRKIESMITMAQI